MNNKYDILSTKLETMANNLVGNVSRFSDSPTIDFFIDIGASETFYKNKNRENELITEWTDLISSYITLCNYVFPNNNGLSICWGNKPTIIYPDGKNYKLYSSFIIVPEHGHHSPKHVWFCPDCGGTVELNLSLKAVV